MGSDTKISWARHTFNAWTGCTKISPACDNCYAETWAGRFNLSNLWSGDRRITSDQNWRTPLRWNREAERAGERHRVFCSSLSDVFDNQVPPEWRQRLFRLIHATPNLDWLLLSKRPQNFAEMIQRDAPTGELPANVWLGVTVENQKQADIRIPHMLKVWASLYFISAEPLLDRVSLAKWLPGSYECASECGFRSATAPTWERCNRCGADEENAGEFCSACGAQDWSALCPDCDSLAVCDHPDTPNIGWVITGGESGTGARPTQIEWLRALRDECVAARVPFHLKQFGEWCELGQLPWLNPGWTRTSRDGEQPVLGTVWGMIDGTDTIMGKSVEARSISLDELMLRVGKKVSGNLLDRREWLEFPTSVRRP